MVPAILTITVAVILLVNFAVHLLTEVGRTVQNFFVRHRALRAVAAAGSSHGYPSLRQARPSGAIGSVLALSADTMVLDRLRRALVLAGYRVDTVESALEAEPLLTAGGYDLFVGGPVEDRATLAALAQLASIPVLTLTPLDAMLPPGGGATTVPWPLGDRRFLAEVRDVLARARERLEAASGPKAELVTVDHAPSPSPDVINVPAGLFIAPNHTWVAIQPNGEVRVGLDEFIAKLVATAVDDVDLPLRDDPAVTSLPLFSVHRGTESFEVESPIHGRVTAVNEALEQDPELLNLDPYTRGWICCLKAENLARDLGTLKLGEQALGWYMHEIEHHVRTRRAARASSRRAPLGSAVLRA